MLLGAVGESGGSFRAGKPRLGDGVTLYAKSSVLGPVVVGDGARIGAHALVLRDVPAGQVAKGVPAA